MESRTRSRVRGLENREGNDTQADRRHKEIKMEVVETMAMRKAITIYTDEGCYIDAVNATWIVKREGSKENGVTMQNFWLKGNNAIYVPIKDADGVPVKAWKEVD